MNNTQDRLLERRISRRGLVATKAIVLTYFLSHRRGPFHTAHPCQTPNMGASLQSKFLDGVGLADVSRT